MTSTNPRVAPYRGVTVLPTEYSSLQYTLGERRAGGVRFVYNNVPTKEIALEIAVWFCEAGYIVTYATDTKKVWVSQHANITYLLCWMLCDSSFT
jgi:hypothetical protein